MQRSDRDFIDIARLHSRAHDRVEALRRTLKEAEAEEIDLANLIIQDLGARRTPGAPVVDGRAYLLRSAGQLDIIPVRPLEEPAP